MKTGFVYTLSHPITGEVRYVGITTNPLNVRFNHHMCVARNYTRKTHCVDWIRSLVKQDLAPVITKVEEAPTEELNLLEIFYIRKFSEDGSNLVNHTSGGKANFTMSEESKAKLSKAHKGKTLTAEHRKNISLAQLGSKHTEETKAKMSAIAMGRTRSPETRKKISKTRMASGIGSGENNSKAKLKEHHVLEIYDKIKLGYTDKELASEYGLTVSGVSGIRHGHNWKKLFEKYHTVNANF